MSDEERQSLVSGQTIFNKTEHALFRGRATTSVGFTFGIGDKEEALQASRYLKGIVVMQWLLVGSVDERYFEKCRGRYFTYKDKDGKPTDIEHSTTAFREEYCRKAINLKYFKDAQFYWCYDIDTQTGLVKVDNHSWMFHSQTGLLLYANKFALDNTIYLKQQAGFEGVVY